MVLPEVDEEQGWEEVLADEGAAPEGSAVGGVGGEFAEFPRISPACFSTWYMASTSAQKHEMESTQAFHYEKGDCFQFLIHIFPFLVLSQGEPTSFGISFGFILFQ